MTIVTPEELEAMVFEASKSAFSDLVRAYPEEQFYTFGLWTDDSLQFLHPVANTESGLDRKVQHYNEKVDPEYDIASTHSSMRWSYGDWAFFPYVGRKQFTGINEKLNYIFHLDISDDELSEIFDPLWDAIINGVARLDAEGFFGLDNARAKITLLLVGDLPDELVYECVGILNPASVADAFVNWVAE